MNTAGTRKWWALGALTLAVLAVGLDGTVLSVAIPTLASALHATESDLQWFSSGYSAGADGGDAAGGAAGRPLRPEEGDAGVPGAVRSRLGGLRPVAHRRARSSLRDWSSAWPGPASS